MAAQAQAYDTITEHSAARTDARAMLDTFFAGLGQGFNAFIEAEPRVNEVERLNAKSDDQLAAMGLKRDEIPRYVFRDIFSL